MKKLIEYINEALILEAFESSTVKEFYNKAKEISKEYNNDLFNHYMVVASGIYAAAEYFHSIKDFKSIASNLGLGKFKDEYLWKGEKEYANKSGVYTQDEVVKMLGINGKVNWWPENWKNDNSLSKICQNHSTMFIGLIETGKGDDYTFIKKIHFAMFIDPSKGKDLINHLKTNFKTKTDRGENKLDDQKNREFNLENEIKNNRDIQTYLKAASDEQKELFKKIVNQSQNGDNKYLADTDLWLSKENYEWLMRQIKSAIGTEENKKDYQNFTKTDAKKKLKLFRYNVMVLLAQPEEKRLTDSTWYKRLNDEAKKYILNAYKTLHKDLKKLSDEDENEINKLINQNWKNYLTNIRR